MSRSDPNGGFHPTIFPGLYFELVADRSAVSVEQPKCSPCGVCSGYGLGFPPLLCEPTSRQGGEFVVSMIQGVVQTPVFLRCAFEGGGGLGGVYCK